jgi:cell division protein FtsB
VLGARRVLLPAAVGAVVLAVLFTYVFPTRAWLAQRDDLAARQRQISELEAEVATLQQRADDLRDPAEIEKLARRDFDLVRPGEQSFIVLPAAPERVELPQGWPFNVLAGQLG